MLTVKSPLSPSTKCVMSQRSNLKGGGGGGGEAFYTMTLRQLNRSRFPLANPRNCWKESLHAIWRFMAQGIDNVVKIKIRPDVIRITYENAW